VGPGNLQAAPVSAGEHWLAAFFDRDPARWRYIEIGNVVTLTSKRHGMILLFEQIASANIKRGLFFDSLVLGLKTSGTLEVHWLPRASARLVLEAVKKELRLNRLNNFRENLRKYWPEYQEAGKAWHSLLTSNYYVATSQYASWKSAFSHLHVPGELEIAPLGLDPGQIAFLSELRSALADGREILTNRNRAFVLQELEEWRDFLDRVETEPLTEAQRRAIVTDEDNNLVIAGAGTGKTSTLVGKAGYVIRKGLAAPGGILLLAFTDKAAQEMQRRVANRLGVNLAVRTFHSLGLEIISETEGVKPSLAKEAEDAQRMKRTIGEVIEDLLSSNHSFRLAYLNFCTFQRVPYRSSFDFKTLGDYYDYLRSHEVRALTGDKVKSLEECSIANWLYLNGIAFEYEGDYEVRTATKSRRQYRTDFRLKGYDIYLEHFAVDAQGNPPGFVDRDEYRSGMEWKRRVHKDNGTILIESYSWESRQGVLLTNLQTKLQAYGVVPNPIAADAVLKKLNEAGYHGVLAELMRTFIKLFKGSGKQLSTIRERAKIMRDGDRCGAFLELFEAVHKEYEGRNRARSAIDFEDMISRAAAYVRQGSYRSPFRYILIDEFQDSAEGRSSLVRALRDQVTTCRLFCVGDDWQSIFRFTGSDVSLMTRFDAHFGVTARTTLDRTFRFNHDILAFSSTFVLRNPSQLTKQLNTSVRVEGPAVILVFPQQRDGVLQDLLAEIQRECPRASVFVLNRYNFGLPEDGERSELACLFPKLRIDFLTIHRSKGLEADYVILTGLRSGRHGFPTGISDDPVLGLVLAEPEEFQHAEERRLFYVAVTRARRRVYLVAGPGSASSFVTEICNNPKYCVSVRGTFGTGVSCPVCRKGSLVSRAGQKDPFFGCSFYPFCTYTEEACPACRGGAMCRTDDSRACCQSCGHETKLCPRCRRGWLTRRPGPRGPFLGCTMFKSDSQCKYTESIY
jgi:DNA helicase-4